MHLSEPEATCRAARRITRLLEKRSSQVRNPSPILTSVASPPRLLLHGEFLAGATNVYLIGRPGTGKSDVMVALGRALVEARVTNTGRDVERPLDAKRNVRFVN